MNEVTRDQFWRWVMATRRNVHPRPEPNYTVWEDLRTREVVGRETPGYLREGPEAYHLSDVALRELRAVPMSDGGA
jgi:hypothetical protein